jgi:hypothetical protein
MASYRATVVADSPAAYWRLGETTGSTANDEIGSNDGTYQNSPTLGAAGAIENDPDKAVTLNGTDEYISVPDVAALDLGDTFTLEAWVKPTSFAASGMVVFYKGTGAYTLSINQSTGTFFLRKGDISTIVTSTTALTTGVWQHIVATKSGATSKLYLNGDDVTGTVTDATMVNTASALNIGSTGAATYFNGSLDELAVYATALTHAQIREHFNIGRRNLDKFDVVIDGEGYMVATSEQERALFGYTPIFVQRQNVEGDYGDNKQDFWLTFTQRDWSFGEQLRYARPNDQAGELNRRFWQGSNIDIRVSGQVSMRRAVSSLTFAAAVRAMATISTDSSTDIWAAGTTNLYRVASDGTITSESAHGLGAAPSRYGLAGDGAYIYLSTTSAGTVGVRRRSAASTYSTFSASGADSLAFLNNTLFGYRSSSADLVRWNTSGTLSSLFTWKRAQGTAHDVTTKLVPFGGKLMIVRLGASPVEIYEYDGTGTTKLAELPSNFVGRDACQALGVVFVVGALVDTATAAYPAVYFYSNGLIDQLWRSTTAVNSPSGAIVNWDGGVVFTDDSSDSFVYYSIATGGTHTLGGYTEAGSDPLLAATVVSLLHTRNQTGGYLFPASTAATTATVTSSLVDFDLSLNKRFKGVTVDFEAGADGNGGTVDVSYRLNDLTGSYTTIQTGITSGTEYAIDQTGRSISIRVTLNKGTSTAGPVLKRVYLRGVAINPSFERSTYALLLGGRDGEAHNELRDKSRQPKDGLEQALDLRAAAESAAPIPVLDEFGTRNVVIDAEGFQLRQYRREEYLAIVPTREV